VPVPKAIGNGQDPKSNLYRGAGYGLRFYFSHKAGYTVRQLSSSGQVLDRITLTKDLPGLDHPVKLAIVAEAWDGSAIAAAIDRFLRLAAGYDPENVALPVMGGATVAAGADAAIVAFVGHDGLMDFPAPSRPMARPGAPPRSSIVLACASQQFFLDLIRVGGSHPLLLTTGLMAPEAYTLEEALPTFAAGGSPWTLGKRLLPSTIACNIAALLAPCACLRRRHRSQGCPGCPPPPWSAWSAIRTEVPGRAARWKPFSESRVNRTEHGRSARGRPDVRVAHIPLGETWPLASSICARYAAVSARRTAAGWFLITSI
jgi:hypothetical protein